MSERDEKRAQAHNVTRLRPPKPCPICKKNSQQGFHPFCSARCADIDLNRWLSGAYAIPGDLEEEKNQGLGEEEGEE